MTEDSNSGAPANRPRPRPVQSVWEVYSGCPPDCSWEVDLLVYGHGWEVETVLKHWINEHLGDKSPLVD